jgi:hypothetical protein
MKRGILLAFQLKSFTSARKMVVADVLIGQVYEML